MTQRWDMGQDTLSQLAKKTGTGTQDLGGLVKQLVAAAQPLEGKMNGAGKAMFDGFKAAGRRYRRRPERRSRGDQPGPVRDGRRVPRW